MKAYKDYVQSCLFLLKHSAPPSHLGGYVRLGLCVRIEARERQVRVGQREVTGPQLSLRAVIQMEAIFQHGQFLRERHYHKELATNLQKDTIYRISAFIFT